MLKNYLIDHYSKPVRVTTHDPKELEKDDSKAYSLLTDE